MHGGAQVYVGEGELREDGGHAAREARHGEEKVCEPGEGVRDSGLRPPPPVPTLATPPVAGLAPHPPVLSRLTRGLVRESGLRGSVTAPACSCWFRSCSISHRSSAPSGRLLFSLSSRALGSAGEDTAWRQSNLAGPSPAAVPPPDRPRRLTCKAHGAEQFLELLELLWGEEQVQGAQLSGHLQLRAEGATGEPILAIWAPPPPSPCGGRIPVARLSSLTSWLSDPGHDFPSLNFSFASCQEGSNFPHPTTRFAPRR